MRFEIININEITAAEYAAVLSKQPPAERERLSGLRPDDRKRSLAARFLAAELAEKVYGRKDFVPYFTENGAPRADFCYLSLAHAGEYAACAVSGRAVGIDIEPEGSFKKRDKYLLFSAAESRFVNAAELCGNPAACTLTANTSDTAALPGIVSETGSVLLCAADSCAPDTSAGRFYTIWTMKEAYIKAAGKKLADAAKTRLVTESGALQSEINGYGFAVGRLNEYHIAVCEELA